MSSTNFQIGLSESNKPSSKVLRPPGGGSSQLFGDDVPNTPRSAKNHMASNIFGSEQRSAVKNNGDSMRRGQKNTDSYSRLFGEPDRNFAAPKNHMKSSIPIGGPGGGSSSSSSAQSTGETNGQKNGNGLAAHHHNGNGHARNGKLENGSSSTSSEYQNGVSKTDTPRSHLLTTSSRSKTEFISTPREKIVANDTNSIRNYCGDGDKKILEEEDTMSMISHRPSEIVNGSLQANNDINMINIDPIKKPKIKPMDVDIIDGHQRYNNGSGGCSSGIVNHSSTLTSSSAILTPNSSPSISHAKTYLNNPNRSPRCHFGANRNPVTGLGLEPSNERIRRWANRKDGNPVTGEGYKGAEINTSIPSLNGANQVINKNRIPPGGYSSGLW